MIQIILAEDHHVVRNGIKALLEKTGNIHVCGEAVNGKEVINLLQAGVEADLLLTDVNMPDMGGLELIEVLKSKYPRLKIVVLSMLDNDKFVAKALRSGAWGYLLKNITPEELIFALNHIHFHDKYICSELSMRFINRLIGNSGYEATDNEEPHKAEFTERELEVLELIAQGLTNADIADRLFASKRTVEGYRKKMLEKTNTQNTAELIRYAMRQRLIN